MQSTRPAPTNASTSQPCNGSTLCQSRRNAGTVRTGGFGAQQQGRASRLRKTRLDDKAASADAQLNTRTQRLFWRSSPRSFASKSGENNLDSSASESASERVVAEYLRSTGGVIPSYAE